MSTSSQQHVSSRRLLQPSGQHVMPQPIILPSSIAPPLSGVTVAPAASAYTTTSSRTRQVQLPQFDFSLKGVGANGHGPSVASAPPPQPSSHPVGCQKRPPPRSEDEGDAPASPPAAPKKDSSAAVPVTLTPLNRQNKNLSEKKLRRLEKNRLSARECRRKKREAAQNLEREINVLEGENLRLRLQLQIGEEAEETARQEQERLTEGLDSLLKSGASESEIYATIEEFKEKFADYGRDRRSAIEFHLRNVERLLMPTTTTSVAMRALQGGSVFTDAMMTKTNNRVLESDGDNTESGYGKAVAATMSQLDMRGLNDDLAENQKGKKSATPAQCPLPELKDEAPASPQRSEDSSLPSLRKVSADSSSATAAAATVHPTVADSRPSQSTSAPLDAISAGATVKNDKDILFTLEPKALFQYLVNYLEVTSEQASSLKDSRSVAKELDAALAKSLGMLQELRQRLTQCGEDLEAEFANVRSILTPTQAAKFLVWVANNGACMHMLNELWSKVYPEPIVEPIDDSDDDIDNNDNDEYTHDDELSSGEAEEEDKDTFLTNATL